LSALLLSTATLFADKNYVPQTIDATAIIGAGQVIVQFKPGVMPTTLERLELAKGNTGVTSIDALLQKYGVYVMEKVFYGSKTPEPGSNYPDMTGFYVLNFPSAVDVKVAMTEFGLDDNAIMAEPIYYWPDRGVPNDPSDNLQYWLQNTTHGMKAHAAWDTQPGDSAILFGVIDSGVNYRHPDLARNIWVNPGEDINHNGVVFDSADINGADDDLNGKIDDLVGWDFLAAAGQPCCPGEDCDGIPDKDPSDFNGHGTFIAGIVAGVTNNNEGGAGIAGGWQPGNPGIRIMCLRSGYLASDSNGYNNSLASSQATDYAVNRGVDVINYSFGPAYPGSCTPGFGYYGTFVTAIRNALAHGVYITASAGNSGSECPDYVDTMSQVISVSAVNIVDILASWSERGTWIDLAAAGVNCFSTSSDYGVIGYTSYDGTSFAAPAVAGVACLLRSQQPTLSRYDLDTLIRNHAENIDGYNNPALAGKIGRRPDLQASMLALPDANFTGGLVAGNTPFTTTFRDTSANSPTSWFWEFGDGQTSTDQNPAPVTYTHIGLYNVSLTVTEPRGTNKHTKWNSVLVTADTSWVEDMYTPPFTGIDTIDVPIYLTNTVTLSEIQIPITWKGTTITATLLNTVDITGTRCSGFNQASLVNIYNGGKVATLKLTAGSAAPLAPGSGMICKLKFSVTNPVKGQKACIRDTAYVTFFQSLVHDYFSYQSEFNSGCINIGLPYICGDADGSGIVNITDAVYLIAYIFAGGPAPDPLAAGDVDCNGFANISDAVYLINYIFGGGPAPCASC
jgi:subtilisin family serine protease